MSCGDLSLWLLCCSVSPVLTCGDRPQTTPSKPTVSPPATRDLRTSNHPTTLPPSPPSRSDTAGRRAYTSSPALPPPPFPWGGPRPRPLLWLAFSYKQCAPTDLPCSPGSIRTSNGWPLYTGPTGQRAGAPTHPALRPASCSTVHALRGTLVHALRGSPQPHIWAAIPAPSRKRSRDPPTRIRPPRPVALRHSPTSARPTRQSSRHGACGLRGS